MKRGKQQHNRKARGLCGYTFSLLTLAATVLCFTLTVPLSGGSSATAAETVQDAGVAARSLQLEGTKLQLQGNLDGAIKKYQESLALQPNPKLSRLVDKLAEKTDTALQAPAGLSTSTEQTPAPSAQQQPETPPVASTVEAIEESSPEVPAQEAIAGSAETESAIKALPGENVQTPAAEDGVKQEQKPVVVEHPAGTPEEELIYEFTDWMLGFLPDRDAETGFGLETNRNYTITSSGEQFEVRLDPFIFSADTETSFDFSPVILTFQPKGNGRLAVQMRLPDKALSVDGDKTVMAEMIIRKQNISGTWDSALQNFEQAELILADVTVQDAHKTGKLDIKKIQLNGLLQQKDQGAWQEGYQGSITGLSFVEGDENFSITKILVESNQSGTNFNRYVELKKEMTALGEDIENVEIADTQVFFNALDDFVQLFDASTSKVLIQGVTVNIDGNMTLDSMELSGVMQKDVQTKGFVLHAKGEAQGFSFTEEAGHENRPPVTLSIDHIGFADNAEIKEFPAAFFANMFTVLDGLEKTREQDQDAYVASHGMEMTKKILALVQGFSTEITLSGFKVVNAMPAPVTLETAKISSGFDVGTGSGGKIDTIVTFSGFNGLDQGDNTIPQAARFALELKNIPSLLNLISDPSGLAEGDIDQLQGQVMMNGMGAFMTSAIALSVTDSFITFPASKFILNLTAQVDNSAKFLSTGAIKIAVENPDDFMRIIQSFGTDPGMQQLLATVTALADRKEENGKVVDHVNAELNPQGRIILNGKDVTEMFLPSAPAGNAEGTGETQPAGAGEQQVEPTSAQGRVSLVETVDPVAREAVDTVLEWNKSYLREDDKVTNAVIDLNNDGIEEVLVRTENMYLCSGSGYVNGCRTWIMQRKDGQWDNIGFPYANEIEVPGTGHHGYADLKIDGKTYIYNGNSYAAE